MSSRSWEAFRDLLQTRRSRPLLSKTPYSARGLKSDTGSSLVFPRLLAVSNADNVRLLTVSAERARVLGMFRAVVTAQILDRRSLMTSLIIIAAVVFAGISAPAAQRRPSSTVEFRGLTVGEATVQDVVATLGQPRWGDTVKGDSLIYDSARDGHTDSLRFSGGILERVHAATPPGGLTTHLDVLGRLGPPEYRLELQSQFMFEYCRHGLRIWFRRDTGRTIGVAYFKKGQPRVAPGEAKFVDLRWSKNPGEGTPAVFRAGVASEIISPPDLSIFKREGVKSIHDNLEARCLVLEKDGTRMAFLGADLFAFTNHEIAPIREAVRHDGIEFLLFASSHTHSAPDTVGVYGYYPAEYVELVQRKCIDCIKKAAGNLTPATIEVGQCELPLDGARIEQICYNGRNPGIVDPFLTVAKIVTHGSENTSGKTLCTLVHFTCHPERLSGHQGAISSDYVGPLRDKVEHELGGTCIFMNGPLGGMLTPDGIPGADRFDDTDRIGRWVGERAAQLAQNATSTITESPFGFVIRPIEIPVVSPNLLEPLEKGTLKSGLIQGRYRTELARVDIGELQIIAIPGELLPELGFAIRERMTGAVNVIVGLANDEIGYIIPAYDFRAGVYEESMSLGPSAGPQIVGAALELLKSK